MNKTTSSQPDYKLMMGKAMIIVAVFFIIGMMIYGSVDYRNQQKNKSCYIDSTAYDIRSYMLYGKAYHDTGYVEKCVVKK